MSDVCPCGALVRVVAVDVHGWLGECEAGHTLHWKTLTEQGRIIEDPT